LQIAVIKPSLETTVVVEPAVSIVTVGMSSSPPSFDALSRMLVNRAAVEASRVPRAATQRPSWSVSRTPLTPCVAIIETIVEFRVSSIGGCAESDGSIGAIIGACPLWLLRRVGFGRGAPRKPRPCPGRAASLTTRVSLPASSPACVTLTVPSFRIWCERSPLSTASSVSPPFATSPIPWDSRVRSQTSPCDAPPSPPFPSPGADAFSLLAPTLYVTLRRRRPP